MPRLFLYHPPVGGGVPDYPLLAAELAAQIGQEPRWEGWDIRCFAYDRSFSFSIRDLRARVGLHPGAVVFVRPVGQSAVAEFRQKHPITPVLVVEAFSGGDLQECMDRVRELHLRREPMLPRKQVVAALLVRGLLAHNYWGSGQQSHSMAWPSLLGAKLPDRLKGMKFEVANDLKQYGLLVTKTKKQQVKWGLNADRGVREEILALSRSGQILNDRLRAALHRDTEQESAHLLIEPEKAACFRVRSGTGAWENFDGVRAAIDRLGELPPGAGYACEVVFESQVSHLEEHPDRAAIGQFLGLYVL
ncbi:MAG: hypothetical protein K2V38_01835 [Gemmataceae bacterium]|nr:hypothetical protein [Gemmataceae bacterium]